MTHYDSDAITRFAHDTAAAGADEFHRHLDSAETAARSSVSLSSWSSHSGTERRG